jgi:hypothetical protein
MRVYTVHMRRDALDPDRDVVMVKEGFCWPAFFFSVFWALWCRLWWVALGLFAANAALSAVLTFSGIDPVSEAAISFGLATLVGLLSNDLKRWTLKRRGFDEVAVVAASDVEAAELRFFDLHPGLASELR